MILNNIVNYSQLYTFSVGFSKKIYIFRWYVVDKFRELVLRVAFVLPKLTTLTALRLKFPAFTSNLHELYVPSTIFLLLYFSFGL